MNLLFATQSNSLDLFVSLASAIGVHEKIDRVGFTLADSLHYRDWLARHPDFPSRGHVLLKEWDVTARRSDPPNRQLLVHYERLLGEPGLFGAIVADRRLLMGPDCTYSQDYRRRFSDDALLSILQAAASAVDRLFDEVKPDLVVTFVCVTILDYLVHLFARARGIPCLNLRPSKIANRFLAVSTMRDPAPELAAAYVRIQRAGSPALPQARDVIARFRQTLTRYEGVVPPSAEPAQRVVVQGRIAAPWRLLRRWQAYRTSEAAHDNHVPGIVRPLLFKGIVNPWRASRVARVLRGHYVTPQVLSGSRYAFYPMHTEPEVSLMVYNRPIVNQIEVIRWIALSLPADMVVVVKEHPWMVGKRSLKAYRKILDIPRVRIAAPDTEARALVEQATFVAVLSSSVGQEAAMLRRPVLALGPCPFNLLPGAMVSHCTDLTQLDVAIRNLLDHQAHDEKELEAYVAALIECSVPVDFYGTLLGRGGVRSSDKTRDGQIDDLARFLLERRRRRDEAKTELPSGVKVASW